MSETATDRADGTGLLGIGALARAAGTTARALRHHDAVGVLRPAAVDPDTGYRWYGPGQVDDARLVARLRGVGVPLEEVRACLAAGGDPAVRERVLHAQRRRLEARLARVRGDLHRLDHLLAGEEDDDGAEPGRAPLPDRPPAEGDLPGGTDRVDERRLAVDLFNAVWRLLETEDRTPEQDDRLLHMAHASRFHWDRVGGPEHRARGEWLCSRVYCALGRPEPALHHARRVLALCEQHGIGDWDLAFASEALARAHALAGDREAAEAALVAARAAGDLIADPADRDLLLADLASVRLPAG